MTYTSPETPNVPPGGGNDGYGWQGQASNSPEQPPYQPYQPYQQSQQPYQPYQPYAQPGGYYAGPMAPATSGYAIASLVCSLLGFIGVFGFGAILGVIFGHMAIREIDRSNGHLQGRGMAQAGLILGYIGIALLALVVLFFIIFFIVGIGAAMFAPGS